MKKPRRRAGAVDGELGDANASLILNIDNELAFKGVQRWDLLTEIKETECFLWIGWIEEMLLMELVLTIFSSLTG